MKALFSNLFQIISKYIRTQIYSKNVVVFLVFLFLSTIFWLLNQLDDEYVTTVAYPVNYTNPPHNKVFVGELPSRLNLEIQGEGFRLLEYKIGKELMPIELNINTYALRPSNDRQSLKYYITTNSARTRIAQQFSSAVQIIDISPDSLFFEFSEKATRKVPIRPNISYNLGQQLMLKSTINIEPDSTEISGPNKIIDTINYIQTRHEALGVVNQTLSFVTSIKPPHSRVNCAAKQVSVTLPVEKFTEGKVRKQIIVKNKPDSILVRTFPKMVNITYLVGLSNYEKVIPELFKVVVPYSQVEGGKENLDVKIENAPGYLKSYSYSPKQVDYIIEKKND